MEITRLKKRYKKGFAAFLLFSLFLMALYIAEKGQGISRLIPGLWSVMTVAGAYSIMKYKFLYFETRSLDSLTGGLNEYAFREEYTKRMKEEGSSWSFLLINIKRFSQVDFGYGREVGNHVLKRVYQALEGEIREGEMICRANADNFYLLLKESDIEKLKERVFKLDDAVYFLEDLGIYEKLFLSIGGYVIKDEKDRQEPIDIILERCNYCREASPDADDRNTHFEVYDFSFSDKRKRDEELAKMAEPALEKGHFRMFLQPKYDVKTETLAGAEALIRWFDPEQGMVPLYEFMPVFEKNGFIRRLDYFIFESTLQLISKWMNEGKQPIKISVNLSKSQFTDEEFFQKRYIPIYEKYQVPKEYLEFEISENTLMDAQGKLIRFVNDLKEQGFDCSMDDFGSGFSSLNTLKSLRVSTVKLDRMMFSEDEKERGRVVTSGIIDIAKSLGIEVVAEGIEKREDVDFLKEKDCDQIQGFYFGKPMPVEELEERLEQELWSRQ